MKNMEQYERSVFIPDLHAPYIDGPALRCVLAFLRRYKPQVVFVIGDVVDFYQLSKFDRNPSRLMELQTDIDAATIALRQIRQAAPQAKIYLLRGNHEYRLKRFLWTKAAELVSLRDLTVPHLLDLKTYNIQWVEEGRMFYHGFCVKHGNLVRTRSGYTATGELEKVGISGLSGHTHRLAQVFKRNDGGLFTWIECGCLCSLSPEYGEGQTMDWMHGLAFGEFKNYGGKRRFTVHVLPIIDGKLVYHGEEISG